MPDDQANQDPNRSSIPSHTPEPTSTPAVDLATLIPADYKDKPYLKDIKDVNGLFAKLDNAQTLIGKRPAGIPQDNAPEAEWQAFHKAWGVPEKPDAYELVVPEKDALPKEVIDKLKTSFHKRGLNAKQAKGLSEDWNSIVAEIQKASGEAAAAQDVDFEKLAVETFGDRKAEALSTSREIIAKYLPEKMKPVFNSLPNEQMIILASVVDGIRKDYMGEDSIPGAKGGKGGGSQEDKRAEARRLMATDAYTNPFHPEHEATKKKVDAMYA